MAVTPLFILIADDYADAVEMYGEYLKWKLPSILQRPIHIVPVLDGASALEQLQQVRFDLVVTDFNMPVISGQMLIEQIRDGDTEVGPQSTPRGVAIIVVTSLTVQHEAEGLRQAKTNGVIDAVMSKPCLPETLASEVLGVLHRRGLVSDPDRQHWKG
jgi:CheY-like chemotaxis protein